MRSITVLKTFLALVKPTRCDENTEDLNRDIGMMVESNDLQVSPFYNNNKIASTKEELEAMYQVYLKNDKEN